MADPHVPTVVVDADPRAATADDRPGTVVEYCTNNVDPESRPVVDALACETRGLPCLERCGTCRRTAFLVLDGTVRTGPSHATLVADLAEGTP